MTPGELARRLGALDLEAVSRTSLTAQCERLAAQIRDALSHPPGEGPHDYPWVRTGELRDSIGAESQGDEAVVASTSPVALWQERGTARVAPRPFLAPIASMEGEAIAEAIGIAVMTALKG